MGRPQVCGRTNLRNEPPFRNERREMASWEMAREWEGDGLRRPSPTWLVTLSCTSVDSNRLDELVLGRSNALRALDAHGEQTSIAAESSI